ncbi:MAG: response regulator, partial [Deltaproteobacteria bacterium]
QLRQSQKMESLGVLAGGIAHDFNNILGAIIGSTELAIGKVDPESRVHRNLERVLTGANRAKELVRQILAFSRQQSSEAQATDLGAVAEEAMTLARASIPTTIELVRDIEPNCPPVFADGTQLHQIIMNLCTNAYHAIGKGSGTITVGVHSEEFGEDCAEAGVPKPGRYVHLSVTDTGCGMDEETKSKIFDPFFTTKGVGEGTGLGLSVVHGIVTKSGGAISVDSEPGKGTTFHIYLPVCEEARTEQDEDDETVSTGNGRVMLVDDETDLLATAGEILEELGYQVAAFSSSREALEAFCAAPDGYDVVVSDQTMPEMTGSEMYEKMADVRPDVRFIVATGFSDTLDPAGARKMGLAGFIPKPYRPRDLAKTVAHVLGQQG